MSAAFLTLALAHRRPVRCPGGSHEAFSLRHSRGAAASRFAALGWSFLVSASLSLPFFAWSPPAASCRHRRGWFSLLRTNSVAVAKVAATHPVFAPRCSPPFLHRILTFSLHAVQVYSLAPVVTRVFIPPRSRLVINTLAIVSYRDSAVTSPPREKCVVCVSRVVYVCVLCAEWCVCACVCCGPHDLSTAGVCVCVREYVFVPLWLSMREHDPTQNWAWETHTQTHTDSETTSLDHPDAQMQRPPLNHSPNRKHAPRGESEHLRCARTFETCFLWVVTGLIFRRNY